MWLAILVALQTAIHQELQYHNLLDTGGDVSGQNKLG